MMPKKGIIKPLMIKWMKKKEKFYLEELKMKNNTTKKLLKDT
jgi:hypothetical protein